MGDLKELEVIETALVGFKFDLDIIKCHIENRKGIYGNLEILRVILKCTSIFMVSGKSLLT